ncbi:hypothetical protein O6H91_01G000900 [Diphasiastrum complanatum]|uniref:Uncharacterized protein n=2 Tax=Diphasiastrum complanatum TaxID=34168 RepID=A0ACC2EMH5_DIPCM|nr:hypothetical protein O6H91_01G000900 [Diphasiastrum complanatum]KAJ7567656.1 hypothetical protein O6H91_01G000900 [Diphasiastrum complanatum]
MMSMTSGVKTHSLPNQPVSMRSDTGSADGLAAMLSSCPPVAFQDLEGAVVATSQKRPRCSIFDTLEETGDEDGADDYGHHVEKKRRLSVEQVKALEKNFELENKLEPERKLQLARELGLQARQVAVWFQNRRARWKTKQLEKDYDILKADYDILRADFNALVQEKEKLQAQVMELNNKLYQEDEKTLKLNPKGVLLDPFKKPETTAKLERDIETTVKTEFPLEILKGETCLYSLSISKLPLEAKEGSSSSDSEDSEILDVDSPRHAGSGNTLSPMQHQTCSEILAFGGLDAGLLHLGEDVYERVHPPSIYQRAVIKLEDEAGTEEHCSGFLAIEDQAGAFSCWDWT